VLVAVRQGRQRRDVAAAGEEQLGGGAAGLSIFNLFYVGSGKFFLAAMYLRRIRVAGRSFAAAPTHVSTVVMPHTSAENISAWASGGPAGYRRSAACLR
jgi:hypothetical protein